MALTEIKTSGIADDAVTTDKLANAINTERTANTAKVSTTINNNADNRVITGSGTANTLEGEANLTYNGTRLNVATGDLAVTGAEGGDAQLRLTADEGDDGADYWRLESKASDNNFNLATYASGAWVDKLSMNTDGHLMLGTSTKGNSTADDLTIATTSNTGVTIRSGTSNEGNIFFADGTSGADEYRGSIQYNHGSNFLTIGTDGSERVRILAGGGITFNGDTATANALDDYEEGTWTPTMHDGNGSNVVLTGTSGACFYTKVGRIVNITGQVTRDETGSKTGRLELTSLPFTSINTDQLHCGGWWMDRGTGNDTAGGGVFMLSDATKIRFVNPTAVHTNQSGDDAAKSATRYLEFSQWENSRHIYFNLTYMAA